MTTAAEGNPPFPMLLRLLELPDGFFEVEVLGRLGPRALASLAGAGRGCAAAVAATALMQWAKDEKNLPAPRRYTFANPVPRLCLREACSLAARGGHLEVMKWLHSTGCPWNAATCADEAAMGGHMAMLQWLHNTGWTWDSMKTFVTPPRVVGTWRCYIGCITPGARGIQGRVRGAPWVGTGRRCSGRGCTTARGTRTSFVHTRLTAGTWTC
jgi:hypothetical protein